MHIVNTNKGYMIMSDMLGYLNRLHVKALKKSVNEALRKKIPFKNIVGFEFQIPTNSKTGEFFSFSEER
ncbi:hypothetical protein [Plebeiibacterium marinum]|uniref:Uncharacterized protein n=1 Tax=Plebeiibacterium marinum TaxID=2992111 RepID=A0AAE3SII2_9BACT|nr:hypothetical protein [Plebeiobacterium marinum]MCW3804458.1 hypothetical protein [Plebeiobacterium marinum]